MPWMTPDLLLDAMDRYNETVIEFAKAHNVPVVDDRNAIAPDAEHFVDCMHLSDEGCSVMAQRFADFLIANRIVEKVLAESE
jgi:hypothetical protein